MKPSILILTLAVLTIACPASYAQERLKVALVDMKRVFTEYHKTQAAERTVNEDKAAAKRELDERAARYKILLEEFQERAAESRNEALSDEVRAAKAKEAQDTAAEAKSLEREIVEYRARRESQLQEIVLRTRKKILDEITAMAEERAANDDYDLVFDKSGLSMNGVNFLLHSKDAVDISSELIADLNGGTTEKVSARKTSPSPR